MVALYSAGSEINRDSPAAIQILDLTRKLGEMTALDEGVNYHDVQQTKTIAKRHR